jgi:hypothetical protein
MTKEGKKPVPHDASVRSTFSGNGKAGGGIGRYELGNIERGPQV